MAGIIKKTYKQYTMTKVTCKSLTHMKQNNKKTDKKKSNKHIKQNNNNKTKQKKCYTQHGKVERLSVGASLGCFQPLFNSLFKGGVIFTVSNMSWQSNKTVPLMDTTIWSNLVLRRCTTQSPLVRALGSVSQSRFNNL